MSKKELELYESIILFKFTTVEEITQERIDFYKNFFKGKGSQVMVKNNGQKVLAYPIKGFKTGTSVQFVYPGNDSLIRQLNIELQRDDFALRALTSQLMDRDIAKIFFNWKLP
jgi:ribosomal protein S6